MIKAWDPPLEESSEQEGEVPQNTTIPGIVGSDMDPKRAGKSILLRMPPSNYMSRVEDDTEIDMSDLDTVAHYRMNVFFTKKSGAGAVLGANFMRGHDVLFDIENNRIGFATSTCEYEALADEEEAGRGELGAGVQNVLARKENDEIAKKEKKQKRNNFDF